MDIIYKDIKHPAGLSIVDVLYDAFEIKDSVEGK